MSEDDLSATESQEIALLIREALARQRLTRQHLADKAKISLSTVEKALSGQRAFTLASVVRLEEALQISLRREKSEEAVAEAHVAPDHLGSYSRAAVKWLEGDYVTIRPSFSKPECVYVYLTEIKWDKALCHLVFRESERVDAAYKQDGAVSVPHQSGYVYLVTNKSGQYRMAVMSKPMIGGEMYGLLTTLQSGRAGHLTPIATPLVLVPAAVFGEQVVYGLVDETAGIYARYQKFVQRAVDEPFVLLVK